MFGYVLYVFASFAEYPHEVVSVDDAFAVAPLILVLEVVVIGAIFAPLVPDIAEVVALEHCCNLQPVVVFVDLIRWEHINDALNLLLGHVKLVGLRSYFSHDDCFAFSLLNDWWFANDEPTNQRCRNIDGRYAVKDVVCFAIPS